jgi:hypothetical protein
MVECSLVEAHYLPELDGVVPGPGDEQVLLAAHRPHPPLHTGNSQKLYSGNAQRISEKIQQSFIAKNLPNLFWAKIREKPRAQSSRFKTQRTPNSIVLLSWLGKELFPQDF